VVFEKAKLVETSIYENGKSFQLLKFYLNKQEVQATITNLQELEKVHPDKCPGELSFDLIV